MNKYIKKCLIVYTSLALILVGMAGAAYAITATDADQYVTRSQYAVDMAHLQNKLDEQEAGLMGSINRFRSTDVKFVTYDTPVNYDSSGTYNGYHNGGNWFPRQKISGSTRTYYHTAPSETDNTKGQYANISMFRIYNGNYIIVPNYSYHNGTVFTYSTVNYAIPCENLPGYYLEVRIPSSSNASQAILSLVKLDPNVPYGNPPTSEILAMDLIFRFKKEFFQYASKYAEQNYPITTTKQTSTSTYSYFANDPYNAPFRYCYRTDRSTSSSTSITIGKWLDPDTGDFMMSLKGFRPSVQSSSTYSLYIDSWNWTVCILLPKDNVEYLCGNMTGYIFTTSDGYSFPHPRGIGGRATSLGDQYWEYEFVDAPNGIKYWHAYRKPRNTEIPGTTGIKEMASGMHYCIPIVY